MGNEKDYLATRVAYKLDLRGPALNIQTACSTSLVAVCQAVQSLLTYQCDMALAGGVSVTLPQKRGYLYEEGAITSPDGRCRAFDAAAAGTVFSNGLGVVVLKRLADAQRDRDTVYAVIKGAALNNDGSSKVSFTAPSVDGQSEAIALAQALAGIDPDTISYVECHGTGTALGDPIEVAALTQAFRRGTAARGFCAIGSLKTSIGHLDAAAGVAGLIKVALALHEGVIPPTLHFRSPNPKLGLEESPFFVNTAPLPWPRGSAPRRAGLSSLGVGGTNAHVVIEEAPIPEPAPVTRPEQLFVLSARSVAALDAATARLAAHLEARPEIDLADAAFTLQTGRRVFAHRRAVVAASRADAIGRSRRSTPRRSRRGPPRPSLRACRSSSRDRGRSTWTWAAACTTPSPSSGGRWTSAPRFCGRSWAWTCAESSTRRAETETKRGRPRSSRRPASPSPRSSSSSTPSLASGAPGASSRTP